MTLNHLKKCLVLHYIWYVQNQTQTPTRLSSCTTDSPPTYSTSKPYSLYKQLVELYGTSFLHSIGHLIISPDRSIENNIKRTNNQQTQIKYRILNLANKSEETISRVQVKEVFENETQTLEPTVNERKSIEIKYGFSRKIKSEKSTITTAKTTSDMTIDSKNDVFGKKSTLIVIRKKLGKSFSIINTQETLCYNLSSLFI